MTGDIVDLFGIEIELSADDLLALGYRVREIGVRGKITLAVARRELESVDFSSGVIERREKKRVAELALILQILHVAVVQVGTYTPCGCHLMRDAGVVIVAALGRYAG